MKEQGKGRYRILMLDDERDVLEWCEVYLSHNGFSFEGVSEKSTFLERIRKNPPHLVILDYRLGEEGDSFDVFLELRRTSPEVKVVFFSGFCGELVDRLKSEGIGEDDYPYIIDKPVKPEELKRFLEALLEES